MTVSTEKSFGFTVTLLVVFIILTFSMIYAHGILAPSLNSSKINPGESFDERVADELLPEGVTEAFLNSDGSMVVVASGEGFGGPVEFIVQIDADGNYSDITMGANSETPNMGGRVKNPEYLEMYYGHRNPQSVDALSSATITSTALKEALELCNQVFEAVR
jgi:hypothetical protein